MRLPALVFLCLLFLSVSSAFAQSSRESESKKSGAIFSKKKVYGKKNSVVQYDKAIDEYEELQKANSKKYKKIQKGMKKSQYSDPSYFGHKKKPKKRKDGKRKFCKECGIIH